MRMESEPQPGSANAERIRVEDLSASFAELSQQQSWEIIHGIIHQARIRLKV